MSGGTRRGWVLGLIGAWFGMASLYYSVASWETHNVAGACWLACVVFYELARRQAK